MATYNMNQVRTGLKVIESGDPNAIIACDFIKPGKGFQYSAHPETLLVVPIRLAA